jgi:hypothetical protein
MTDVPSFTSWLKVPTAAYHFLYPRRPGLWSQIVEAKRCFLLALQNVFYSHFTVNIMPTIKLLLLETEISNCIYMKLELIININIHCRCIVSSIHYISTPNCKHLSHISPPPCFCYFQPYFMDSHQFLELLKVLDIISYNKIVNIFKTIQPPI